MSRPAAALRMLRRGLGRRCPRCGHKPIFRRWVSLVAACPLCGLRFEREHGYFVGAIYLNYAATALMAVPGYLLLRFLFGLALETQIAIWGSFCVLFPVFFFPWSKSLWLALDYLVDPREEEP